MVVFDLENFKEVISLIDSMQEAVALGIERELKKPKQKKKIVKMDRSFIQEVSGLLQGKWTVDILWMILFLENPFFNDIRRALPEINTRTLATRLKSLEEKELIKRTVHTGKPVRVSYKITKFGKGLTFFFFPFGIYVILERNKKRNESNKKIDGVN